MGNPAPQPELPPVLAQPTPPLAAAWNKFINNQENFAHPERDYIGGSLQEHLKKIWRCGIESASRVASQTPGLNPKDILDVGASTGGVSLGLYKQYPDATIYAIEPEDEAFEVLAAMRAAIGGERFKIFHGVGEALPLPDSSIDLIICHTVLEHVRSPAQVLAEMYRVLRPGGMVHMEVPNYIWPIEPHLHTFFVPFAGKRVMKFLGRLQGLSAAQVKFMDHLQLVTKPEFEGIIRKLGFQSYNLTADKMLLPNQMDGHVVLSGWKRRMLTGLRENKLGKTLLVLLLKLGLYPSLLYRLQKPAR